MGAYVASVNGTFKKLAKLCVRRGQGLISLTGTESGCTQTPYYTRISLFHPETHSIATSTQTQREFLPPPSPMKSKGIQKKSTGLCKWKKEKKRKSLVSNASACLGYAHHLTNSWGHNSPKEGEGGLDNAKVIKVSKQVNVKSGSNLDLFPCQRIMSLIYTTTMYIWT